MLLLPQIRTYEKKIVGNGKSTQSPTEPLKKKRKEIKGKDGDGTNKKNTEEPP